MGDTHTISAGGIAATIKADGAELCSLKAPDGLELLWQAGPAWPRHAPWLFPIVGRLANDELRHRGKGYKLTQHGFARDMRFQWQDASAEGCALVLTDSAATRLRYPFAFRLTIRYRICWNRLELSGEITNTGHEVLPASFGAHPAFNWPIGPGTSKQDHFVIFTEAELAPVRRVSGGLLRAEAEASPVEGTMLTLSERLFDDDAIIFDALKSTALSYIGSGPGFDIAWGGFRQLGIWSKPGGAPFLCIEPWRGFASPVGFDGDFSDKPGLMHIAPGATERLVFSVKVHTVL